MNNVLELKKKDTQQQSWKQCIEAISLRTRQVPCPVATKFFGIGQFEIVTEYLLPVNHIVVDLLSQARISGKSGTVVAQLTRQFETDGQREGICIQVQKKSSTEEGHELIIRWGSHRWNATKALTAKGVPIKGAVVGYIWASVYNEHYQNSDLNKLQAIENNIVQAKERANDEDNLAHLKTAMNDGDLDLNGVKFKDLSEKLVRQQLTQFIKDYMGSNVKHPISLIKKFLMKHKAKIRTDTKTTLDHQNHWNLYEKSNFGIEFKNAGQQKNTQLDKKRRVHAQYHYTDGPGTSGATFQQMWNAKFSFYAGRTPATEVIHLVVSLPLGTCTKGVKAMSDVRSDWIKNVEHWNKVCGTNLVDYLYIMPQTAPEEADAAAGTKPWIHRIKL